MIDLTALKDFRAAGPFADMDKIVAETEAMVSADVDAVSAANKKVVDSVVKSGELAQGFVQDIAQSRIAFSQSLLGMTSFDELVEAGKAYAGAEQKKATEFAQTISSMAKDLGEDVAADLAGRFNARIEKAQSAFAVAKKAAPAKAAPVKAAPKKAAAAA